MPNRLAREKSPYLLQHADNPVDWYPWGDAAFARARAEEKPIFLSIGYSTCHWCHVMAHESFEDALTAALLNEHFVSIKVDREERPDVDRIYMTYVQALSGHGGWPLSAWLTPELKPFYGGTYFPPNDRHGRPGFPSVLRAIAQGWSRERSTLVAEGERAIGALRAQADQDPSAEARGEVVDLTESAGEAFEKGFQHFYESFDPKNGGFGEAPKFPRASNLNFLFRVAAVQGPTSEAGAEAVKMAIFTLQKMAQGGIHDVVGGGFHRYSVDGSWFVPHFEKMLYDQAQIAVNYLDARLATGQEVFSWMAYGIFEYVRRDLTTSEGAFLSAEDADSAIAIDGQQGTLAASHGSRKVEGAFYVWTKNEIEIVLGENAPLVCLHYGVLERGNVDPLLDPHAEFRGKNILAQRQSLSLTARQFELSPEGANDILFRSLEKLRVTRATRPRPHLDDKIITAWNGLMISALARAQSVLTLPSFNQRADGGSDNTSYADRATRAAEFIFRELFDSSRVVLYRNYCGGRSLIEGFAEDYAFLIQGLLDLYEVTFEIRWLQWAEGLQRTMDSLFWDERAGGYFHSAAGDPTIILRLKDDYDGAEPAANSVAAMNLLRIAAISGDEESYRRRALRTLTSLKGQWERAPQALPQALCAIELALEPPRQVVLAGDSRAPDFRSLLEVLHERLGPRRTVLALNSVQARAWFSERSPWLAEMDVREGRATAYVCEHYQCHSPVTDPGALRALLSK